MWDWSDSTSFIDRTRLKIREDSLFNEAMFTWVGHDLYIKQDKSASSVFSQTTIRDIAYDEI